MASGSQVRVSGQIHTRESDFRLAELMEALQHPIQMRTTVSERLFNRLVHQVRWIVLMQTQHADKLLHSTSPLWPFLAQESYHLVVTLGPVLAPLPHGSGVVEGPRSLFQQGKIM
jgi:hypothetical protein